MRIAMLARNPNLYSHKRLVEAAEERGHEIDIINTLKVYINVASHRPEMRYRGEKLEGYDAVIPRIGASVTFFGTAVLRQFEVMGVYPLNESVAISRSRDKLRSLQLLARRGIGLPVTVFAHSTGQADDILDILGGAGGDQAAGGHPGHRRRSGRDGGCGKQHDPGVWRPESQHPGPGVHQGGRQSGHPLPGGGRQGCRVDDAPGGGGRLPLQPAPRRQRPENQDHTRRSARPPCAPRGSWA